MSDVNTMYENRHSGAAAAGDERSEDGKKEGRKERDKNRQIDRQRSVGGGIW